jgi:hypothetical protein
VSGAVSVRIEPTTIVVNPGEVANATLTIRNTGSIVERFTFEVLGDVAGWTRVDPSSLSLLPGTERTVGVVFSPPRAPDPVAGLRPFGIKVVPTAQPAETEVAEGDITVTPFAELAMVLRPATAKGTWKGRFRLLVQNRGNTQAAADVSPIDPDDTLTFRVSPRRVEAPPGGVARSRLSIRPRRVMVKGNPERRNFKVGLFGEGAPPTPQNGTFVQRPILARWVPRAVALGAAVIVGGVVYAHNASAVHDVATTAPAVTTTSTSTTSTTSTTAPTTATTVTGATTSAGSGGGDSAVTAGLPASDCVGYNQVSGVAVSGSSVSLSGSGSPTTLNLDTPSNASMAATLARHYRQVCDINAGVMSVQVWSPQLQGQDVQQLNDVTPTGCQQYNPQLLTVQSVPGLSTLTIFDTDSAVAAPILPISNTDPSTLLKLARGHSEFCWIGGGAKGWPDPGFDTKTAVFFWK